MAQYLMAVTVGPIQDFIASARRTRDLWFGSRVLSDVSRAAARVLQVHGSGLIFPDSSLLDKDIGHKGEPAAVANVILAEIDADDPKHVATLTEAAAKAEWKRHAKNSLGIALGHPAVAPNVDQERWARQVDDVVEFYAAWVPFPDHGEYRTKRQRLMRLLAGRKSCRNFLPSPETEMRVRKSSLDGARETIWKDRDGLKSTATLRLNAGEHLDAVGLTKRLAGDIQKYPSVSRIAADAWLFGLALRNPERTATLRDRCEKLVHANALTRIDRPHLSYFPYEGSVIFADRHTELAEQSDDPAEAAKQLKSIGIRNLYKEAGVGEPVPYLAVLSADGDKMGRLISNVERPEDHRSLSVCLTQFAAAAGRVIEDHYGVPIYSGGDDVLAFVPVDLAHQCAFALTQVFGESLKDFCLNLKLPEPTLSVGIGIGHFMEPLEDLREWSKQAEKHAKQDGANGLAVHFHTRGGEPSAIRGGWQTGFYQRFEKMIGLFRDDSLADKTGYDLQLCARRYDGLTAEWVETAIRKEAAYILGRKRGGPGHEEIDAVVQAVSSAAGLHALALELIVARRIASARKQASSRSPRSFSGATA